jgi:tripartite ATP-independent transporter DctP family solute receptor
MALLALVLAFALAACGGGGSGESSDGGDATETTSDSSEAQTSSNGDEDVTILRVGHIEAEGSFLHKSALEFEKDVEEKTGGRVDIQIYANSELGDEGAVLQSIQMGSMEMCITGTASLTQFDDRMNAVFLPFLFDSPESCEAAIKGDFGKLINGWIEEYGFKALAWQYDGARNIANNKRPIHKLEDVDGLKLRCMNSDIFIEMFRLMGINATPMAYSEIYTAVQQGVVDGNDNPAGLFVESKFYEVHKYYSLSEHTYGTANAVISLDKYNSLPEDVRGIIDEASKTFLEDWQINKARAAEKDYIEDINENGCEVNELDPGEKERFVEVCSPLYQQMRDKWGDETWKEIETALGRELM